MSATEEYADTDVTSYDIDTERLDLMFTYHPPDSNDEIRRYTMLRDAGRKLAQQVMLYTPKSREQSLALTKIEEAIMWANASIARNE